jgi:methionine synthase I (cobalamin-dependent)
MKTIVRPTVRQLLEDLCAQRILILDGAMGTMIQQLHLAEADYPRRAVGRSPPPPDGL